MRVIKTPELIGKFGNVRLDGDQIFITIFKSDETHVRPLSELPEWVERLKITETSEGNIRMSNWFEGDE